MYLEHISQNVELKKIENTPKILASNANYSKVCVKEGVKGILDWRSSVSRGFRT